MRKQTKWNHLCSIMQVQVWLSYSLMLHSKKKKDMFSQQLPARLEVTCPAHTAHRNCIMPSQEICIRKSWWWCQSFYLRTVPLHLIGKISSQDFLYWVFTALPVCPWDAVVNVCWLVSSVISFLPCWSRCTIIHSECTQWGSCFHLCDCSCGGGNCPHCVCFALFYFTVFEY